MNILPLIIAFILVFSFCTSLFIEEKKTTFVELKNYISYMNAERNLRNQLERKSYKMAGTSQKQKGLMEAGGKKSTILQNKSFTNRRDATPPLQIAKLNIALLLEDSHLATYPVLYETAAKLLKSLYSHASFYKEGIEYQILDTIIINKAFNDLSPFKILKGTTYYNIQTKEGYPPLEDFFSLDKTTKDKPIFFCFATTPLLNALLGEKLTAEILEKEKKKWSDDHKHHTVTKTELQAMAKKLPPTLFDILNFSQNASPKQSLIVSDPSTNLTIRKKV